MNNLSEEEKRAIEELKSLSPSEQSIDSILNLIEKQDKLINILAVQLTTPVHNKEWVIKYWTKILNTIEEE